MRERIFKKGLVLSYWNILKFKNTHNFRNQMSALMVEKREKNEEPKAKNWCKKAPFMLKTA